MADFTYPLDKSSCSSESALFLCNFITHCNKAKEGKLGNRFVHTFIAVLEFLPVVSQISSIFNKLNIDNFSYKSKNDLFTDTKISLNNNPSTTAPVSQLFSQGNKCESQALENEDPLINPPKSESQVQDGECPDVSPLRSKILKEYDFDINEYDYDFPASNSSSQSVGVGPQIENDECPAVSSSSNECPSVSSLRLKIWDEDDEYPLASGQFGAGPEISEIDSPVSGSYRYKPQTKGDYEYKYPAISSIKSESQVQDDNENPLNYSLNFQNMPGRHTIKSPVVASRVDELLAVKKAMKSESILIKLEEAIYQSIFIFIIPITKKNEADEIARGLFLDYISKYSAYGCTEQNIVRWGYTNKTYIYDLEDENNTWTVHAAVRPRHGSDNEKYNGYLPPHVVAYHEIMHVEETPLKAKEIFEKEKGNELLTTIKTIILLDTVYKKIHDIGESTEVDYNKLIDINGIKIKLGRFANFFREKESELKKLYLALISPESINFLKGKIK